MTRNKNIFSSIVPAIIMVVLFAMSIHAQTGLKDRYANYFRVGNIFHGGNISNNSLRELVLREYNSITHENELKPDATMLRAGSTDNNIVVQLNTGARNILKFCEDNNIPVRGHVLVWHGQSPHWFFTSDLSVPSNPGTTASVNWATKAQMETRLESYINNLFALIKRDYPNLNLYAYDVVNEAVGTCNSVWGARCPGYDFNGAGGVGESNAGNSPWVQIYGDNSFIERAFMYAAAARDQYFPNMKLFYNDYNEWDTPKMNHIIDNILVPLRDKGLLDGMGMQGHVDANPAISAWSHINKYTTAMSRYAQLGIEVQITELDVGMDGFTAQQQADKFKAIFNHAVEINKGSSPGKFTAICIWGLSDNNSWRNDNPTLHNSSLQAKTSYTAVGDVVPQNEWGDGNNPPCCTGGAIHPPSSSSVVPSSSSASPVNNCGYQPSFCGGATFANVSHNSTAMPATGACLFVRDFEVIQPNLNSAISINGVENVCGNDWDDCPYNTKPNAIDSGYYVYIETGTVNSYENNGWQSVVAGTKLNCASFATPSSSSTTTPSSSSSEGNTPIQNRANPIIGAIGVQTIYYNLKGEPLGTQKPTTPGVYIIKNIKTEQTQMMVVK